MKKKIETNGFTFYFNENDQTAILQNFLENDDEEKKCFNSTICYLRIA